MEVHHIADGNTGAHASHLEDVIQRQFDTGARLRSGTRYFVQMRSRLTLPVPPDSVEVCVMQPEKRL